MEWILIGVFSLSAILLLLSFFQKNPHQDVEKQLENLSIQMMQEIYYLKKKVTILEEEYVIGDAGLSSDTRSTLTRDDVLAMHEDGHSVEEIASITENSIEKIEQLLAQ
jgi:hypothetical protein